MEEERVPRGINFNRLLKDEILWLFNHRCDTHHRRFTEHPQCFLDEYKGRLEEQEKIGFVDIETTNLNADFGYILCYSLKELDGELVHKSITPREIRSYRFDKNVVREFLNVIKPYDRLVGYYSKDYRFDMPYLRTRALKWDLNFPEYKDYLFTDAYDLVKAKMRLHRSRMETACDFLGIPSKGHRLNPEVWQRCQAGSKQALDYVQMHCDEDVLSLEALFKRLHIFSRVGKASI